LLENKTKLAKELKNLILKMAFFYAHSAPEHTAIGVAKFNEETNVNRYQLESPRKTHFILCDFFGSFMVSSDHNNCKSANFAQLHIRIICIEI
jgi:hypothetical protein